MSPARMRWFEHSYSTTSKGDQVTQVSGQKKINCVISSDTLNIYKISKKYLLNTCRGRFTGSSRRIYDGICRAVDELSLCVSKTRRGA